MALLNRLQLAVETSDRRRGKKHVVWKDSFDVKECRTEKFVLQNYIIYIITLVQENGNLQKAATILHSSALFYLSGKHSCYPVKDYRVFLYPDQGKNNIFTKTLILAPSRAGNFMLAEDAFGPDIG